MNAARRASAALPVAALFALAAPVLAGIAWMGWAGSPESYRIINAAALALATLWLVFARQPATLWHWRYIGMASVAVLCLPFVTGPAVNTVSRWVALGPLALNSGALAVPTLVVAAARDSKWGPYLLGAALVPLSFQPDAAAGLALTFAAAGMHDRTKAWRYGLVCVLGFALTISMALRGELPPQMFVERVLIDAARGGLLWLLVLMLALIASFFTILKGLRTPPATAYALAGALFGFFTMALVSHYPAPFVGYGAAPILGFGLALGLAEGKRR